MPMNRIHSHLEQIEWIGKLADLKEGHYQHSLLISAILELLMDKGLLTAQEIADKVHSLEQQDEAAALPYTDMHNKPMHS